jgi:hypothetical protein
MFPRIFHTYWGMNAPLSYLRYLTIKSFQKLNPDWTIKVWTPKVPSLHTTWNTGEQLDLYHGHDYMKELWEFVDVVDFESIGIPNETPEVHKSDLLRWYLLGTYGGIWSDMDILYIKPIADHQTDSWIGAGLCKTKAIPGSDQLFSVIGFLTSAGAGQIFFKQLFDYGVEQLPQSAYQAFGALLLDSFARHWMPCKNVPFMHNPDIVYPYCTGTDIQKYFNDFPIGYSDATNGFHWFAGNPWVAVRECKVDYTNIHEYADKYALCGMAVKYVNQI